MIDELYEKVIQKFQDVQTLDTRNKLRDIKGYTRLTLGKLPGIRADLVKLDDEWQKRDFTS